MPGTTSSVSVGDECCLLQFGTAAMLISRLLGGLPSSLTVPLTDPAVSASTGLPDGLIVRVPNVSDVSCLFPPQLAAVITKMAICAESKNLGIVMSVGSPLSSLKMLPGENRSLIRFRL